MISNAPRANSRVSPAAATDASVAARYRLNGVLAWLDAGDRESAMTLMAEPLDPAVTAHAAYPLVLAAADDGRTEPEAARARLDAVDANRLSPYQRNVYQRTLGRVELAARDFEAAAQAFIAADAYVLPADHRAALHRNTWTALSHMDGAELAAARARANGREAGWLALAMGAGPNLHDAAALATAIETWRATHSQHPANVSFVESLFELSESLAAAPRHIALLLPFTGPYAGAAEAIRDGFVSGWYADAATTSRPSVSIYDATTANVDAAYETAVQNGADFIVGPLEKPAVEALAARAELPVRTMALNVAESASGAAGFFQFGLTPEAEAAAVARKAWADGHTRAIAMTPETAWGQRVGDAFAREWERLGGDLLNRVAFGGEETTYSRAVKTALNVDLSEARASALRQALGRAIVFEPRRREDVEAIFIGGFPVSARQLLPQFRYFRAETVPMYATSHAYTGRVNAGADRDLNGLRFGDMPWLLGLSDTATRAVYQRNWPDSAPGSARLFAFGLDAYRLLPYLARMRHQPGLRIPGTTGTLGMDSDGRVSRELAWARFADGVPQLIDR